MMLEHLRGKFFIKAAQEAVALVELEILSQPGMKIVLCETSLRRRCRYVKYPRNPSLYRSHSRMNLDYSTWFLQCGTADAEIKVPSFDNPEADKRSLSKDWSRSEYSHTCFAHRQDFLHLNFDLPGPFTFIFFPQILFLHLTALV